MKNTVAAYRVSVLPKIKCWCEAGTTDVPDTADDVVDDEVVFGNVAVVKEVVVENVTVVKEVVPGIVTDEIELDFNDHSVEFDVDDADVIDFNNAPENTDASDLSLIHI